MVVGDGSNVTVSGVRVAVGESGVSCVNVTTGVITEGFFPQASKKNAKNIINKGLDFMKVKLYPQAV